MASDMNAFMSKCDMCQSHRTAQQKKPLQQHEILPCPWAKVLTDLLDLNGSDQLVVINDYRNFIEVETSSSALRILSSLFFKHSIPDVFVSDNGPQFP